MDSTKIAPLVLRLGRHQSLRTRRIPLKSIYYSPFSSSTVRPAAPLPPQPEELAGDHSKPLNNAPESLSQPPPPPPKQSLRPYIWAAAFALVGVTANAVMRAIVFPPPLPEPDTEEDAALVSRIKADLNDLPMITELRKDRSAWREYDPYSQREAFMSGTTQSQAEVDQHMTAGTLRGARGLAVQRSFYNAAEKREISVVFFGGAVSGWPGVTHGGLIMTVLKEALERAANGPVFASRSEDGWGTTIPTEGLGDKQKRLDCETVTLTYKKPTQANRFYVIRAEVQEASPMKPGHLFVKASLEDALTGVTTVFADGYCIRGGAVGQVQSSVSNSAGGLWSSITNMFGSTVPSKEEATRQWSLEKQ